jgi:hypothetical protein
LRIHAAASWSPKGTIRPASVHLTGLVARLIDISRLGSCLLPEPISALERIRFWDALPGRWRQHPRLIDMSLDDRRRALDQIAERIPQPSPSEIAQVLERLQRWAA